MKMFMLKYKGALQNTDLDMREFLGIDETLQTIQVELLNNTSKLTKFNEYIKKKEVKRTWI